MPKKNSSKTKKFLVFSSLALTVFSSGCSSFQKKYQTDAVGQVIRGSNGTVTTETPQFLSKSGHLEVWGKKLKNSKFDYPVMINPAVEHWLTYFTGKGRKYFEKYLARGRYFIPTISKVLKSHNAPQDLVYLAMIESGFNNSAKSHAKAVGPWQFIRQTGQRYGLTIDYWIDERRDTAKSTLAAIAYLKELNNEFGSWELAAAGYNSGENKVRRAIAKYKTNDFWEIARHRFFKRETRDYVPKIMAAAIITKNPELFGFTNPFSNKGEKGVKNPTVFDDESNSDEELTPKELGEVIANDDTNEDPSEEKNSNPSLAEMDVQESESEDISGGEALDSLVRQNGGAASEEAAVVLKGSSGAMSSSAYMVSNPNEQIIEYEVKGPADLFAISKASGLPFSTLKLLNPELLRWCTPPTMKTYRVKMPKSVKERFLATYNDDSFDRKVVFMQYKVKSGDTVQKIARKFRVEPQPIREINALSIHSNALRLGLSLQLPIPTGYKRVIASIYDDKPMPSSGRSKRRLRRLRRHNKRDQSSVSQHMRRSGDGVGFKRIRPNLAIGNR